MNYWVLPGLEERSRFYLETSEIAKYYGMTMLQIREKKRLKRISDIRHIAIWFVFYRYSSATLMEIGEFFNRNHASVLHATRKIDNLISYDISFRKDLCDMLGGLDIKHNLSGKCIAIESK